jgi:hypothetical protein
VELAPRGSLPAVGRPSQDYDGLPSAMQVHALLGVGESMAALREAGSEICTGAGIQAEREQTWGRRRGQKAPTNESIIDNNDSGSDNK